MIASIGQGGMGSVWLARRSDGRFERQVAIKFLSIAVGSETGVQRFRRQGRILGQLTHPHIAELIDAGVTDRGEPYLVLEDVEGEPIDKLLRPKIPEFESRIRLFLDDFSPSRMRTPTWSCTATSSRPTSSSTKRVKSSFSTSVSPHCCRGKGLHLRRLG